MATVKGNYDERFAPLAELLTKFVESGEELGASICLNLDGKNVVDIWAGYNDKDHSSEWQKDTITNVWSSTKTVSSLAMLMLVDRGLVDLDAPVAKYWPEFAQNGKENVLIKHIISHTSGVSGWADPVTYETIEDFDKSSDMLATQAPWWEPGTASGYHALNMGHLIGGVVKRVTGKSLKQFVAEEIAGPLGADFQIGCRESEWGRISNVIPPPTLAEMPAIEPGSAAFKTFTNPAMDAARSHTAGWRNADIGAANGHGNARSLVRMLSPITLGGTVSGLDKPLLSQATIDKIFVQQVSGKDQVILLPLKFLTGFGGASADTMVNWFPEGRVAFWGGWGGSIILMDLERKMTFSYVMNKMDNVSLGGTRTKAYAQAAWKCLGVELPAEVVAPKI